MTDPAWTRTVITRVDGTEMVLLEPDQKFAVLGRTARVDGLVQAHDGDGRPVFDREGRPIMVAPNRQDRHYLQGGVLATVLIVLAALTTAVAAVVCAYYLHELARPSLF